MMTDDQAKRQSKATRMLTAEERIATSTSVKDYLADGWRIIGTTCLVNSSLIHVVMSSPDMFEDSVVVILQ